FVLSLPKAELHLHLEGSVEPATLVELRQQHGMPGAELAEVERLYEYHDFNAFLMAFKAITEHLQAPEDWELITYRLMQRLRSENVLHAEVYFTAAGQKTILIDSGALAFLAGQIRTVVASDATGGYTSTTLADVN